MERDTVCREATTIGWLRACGSSPSTEGLEGVFATCSAATCSADTCDPTSSKAVAAAHSGSTKRPFFQVAGAAAAGAGI